MKTKRKIHGKRFFLIISVFVLLLAALSVGTTLGKYTLEINEEYENYEKYVFKIEWETTLPPNQDLN